MNGSQGPDQGKKPWSILLVFFGLAYFCQHFGQAALVSQPLTFYFKEVLGYGPTQISAFFTILTLPWVIKPVYGLISDFIPLLGYRRKSYLLVTNLVASAAFLSIAGITDVWAIQMALLLSSFCCAFSDVAVDGLMVEMGNKTGDTARYQSMQWLWLNVASIITSLAGGYATQYLPADSAYKIAAAFTAIFPLVLAIGSWMMVKEDKATADKAALLETTRGLWLSMKSKTLWLVLAFLAFWQFSPSFGMPMYFHQTNVLKFSQEFIGQLGAMGSAASVVGAIIFLKFLAGKFRTKTLLYASTNIGVVGTLAYILLLDPATTGTPLTAIILAVVFGIAGQVSTLAILNLAAENCPKRAEALTFAALMSVYNFAGQGSQNFGSYLYEYVFNSSLLPLILVSAAFTFACFFFIPLLPDAQPGDEGKK